jgi:diacylglycerol kinase family enzyme
VANTSQYGGGAVIAPNAQCDDGLFDLCILEEMGIVRAAFGFIKLFTGKIDRAKAFTRILTERVEILRERGGVMHVDGEPFVCSDTKLIFTNLPKALKVMVPRNG